MVSNMKNIFDSSGFRDIYNNIKTLERNSEENNGNRLKSDTETKEFPDGCKFYLLFLSLKVDSASYCMDSYKFIMMKLTRTVLNKNPSNHSVIAVVELVFSKVAGL